MILIFADSRFKIDRRVLQKAGEVILKKEGRKETDNLNIVFVGTRKMKQIARAYKKENVAHPIVSFSYVNDKEEKDFIGEIIICYPQAVLLAAEREKRVHVMIIQLIEHGIRSLK